MSVAFVITTAVRRMSRDCTGWRCSSSSIIVPNQISRLAVIVSTTPTQQVPGEALGRVDVANLLTLRLGHRRDLGRLARSLGLVVVPFRDRRGVADSAHRDGL